MAVNPKVAKYLQRINYTGSVDTSLATLEALQLAHLESVPYENLDIINGIPLSLAVDDLYKKVVEESRGGYCFELNPLFAWLLREIGFTVHDYMARFLLDEPEIPMRRHHVLGVTIGENTYIADVGVGLTIPRRPYLLAPGQEDHQNGEVYKLEAEAFLGYVLYEKKSTGFRPLYSFTLEPQIPADYIAPSFYCEKHPDSIFNKQAMVHIFTKDGRKSIDGNIFKIFTKGADGTQVNTAEIEGKADFDHILKTHFGY